MTFDLGRGRRIAVPLRDGNHRYPRSRLVIHSRCFLVLFGITVLGPASVLAGDAVSKVRDIRRDRKTEGFYAVFCARNSPGVTGFPGHAYVVLGRDDEDQRLCAIAAFGFQPADEEDRGIVKAVPGEVAEPYVKDYDKPLPGVCRLILKVDRSQFDAVDAVRKKWSDREYRLSGPNCIDFADDAAKALNLARPKRSRTQRPHSYIHQLTEQN
jgi:hypothetical protein